MPLLIFDGGRILFGGSRLGSDYFRGGFIFHSRRGHYSRARLRAGSDIGESSEEHLLHAIADGVVENQIDDAGEA